MKSNSSIVDSGLYIYFAPHELLQNNSLFDRNGQNRGHFGSQLLLYDRIIIPTKEFGIIPILVRWLGIDLVVDALKSGAFGFFHRKSLLGYIGNGNGIVAYALSRGDAKISTWWQEAMFSDGEVATDLQLKNLCPDVSLKDRQRLVKLVVQNTLKTNYDNETFMRAVVHESYMDIINNPRLSDFIRRHTKDNEADLTRLIVNPREMRVSHFGAGDPVDPVDLVLKIAEANMEILIGSLIGEADLFTSAGTSTLLRDKLARSGLAATQLDSFLSLLELNEIPDVRSGVADNVLPLPEIWRIRNGRRSRKFRHWLKRAGTKDAREIEKLYVEALGKKSWVAYLPARIMRFAITTTAGVINPFVGVGLGLIDSFFVERFFSGFTPRLFLDELRNLGNEAQQTEHVQR